jgi:nucleoside 2-deoxyribosyltransferase
MKIYFAGSIRGGRDDKDLYSKIITLLSKFGAVLTEHVGDKTLSALGEDGPNNKFIHKRDMKWLKKADLVIAEVTTASLGVGYEIAKAEEWNKKILCLYRPSKRKRLSAMISGSSQLILKEYRTIKEVKNIFSNFFKEIT